MNQTRVVGLESDERVTIPSIDAPPPPRTLPGARPMLLVLAIAAAAVAWVSVGPGDRPSPTAELPAPEQPFVPLGGEWRERTFEGTGGFTDAAIGPPGLVAVATGRRVDSLPLAQYTNDGMAWRTAQTPWIAGDVVRAVEWTGKTFFAVGYRPNPERSDLVDAGPILARSDDGLDWTTIEAYGLPERAVITGAATGGDQTVVIGWVGQIGLEPTAGLPEGATARVWSSTDLEEWVDITPSTAAPTWFTSVAIFDDSLSVTGSDADGPSVWTREQTSWSQVTLGSRDDHVAVAGAPSDSGLVVLVRPRFDIEGVVSVWRIDQDGGTQRIRVQSVPDSSGWVRQLDGGLVAGAGFTRTFFPDGPELYVSETGETWTGVQVTSGRSPWPPAVVGAIERFEGAILAFGSRGGVPVVWALADHASLRSTEG